MAEPASDKARLCRAVDGDAEALAELLREHGPPVESTLRIDRAWRAQLDPADVMQVTYIEAFRNIREFDPDRADRFPGWLRQMAENNLRDAIRGLTRQKRGGNHVQQAGQYGADLSEGLALLAVTTTTPSHTARHDERVGHLQAAISRLPADYARVVHLLDLEGQSIAQAASAMNRSAGAVHMLRARAYDRLIALLGPASAFFSEP